ncbi:protein SODIUM POTASSIUM ROOT DEFECTIVE 3 [Diospyros lotus]|uniref:protein SODIUM POTASSIUM ROOT DEFECTIVE 3 n=1 Tax=Diospyros lotus TaxID=55363 RepID=UPI00225ACEB5|nr:protein SODIUM POTASSIUM ROOT DEFECTIVE 3 [Diospyros lotus]
MFCASQAATAITLTMEGAPSSSSPSSSSSALASSSSTAHLGSGSRAIDRHNPIIRDARRLARSLPRPPPCASQTPPVDPVPYSLLRQKGSATGSPVQSNNNDSRAAKKKKNKESSAAAKPSESDGNGGAGARKSVLANKAGDFSSPAASTRYLLGTETAFLDVLTDFGPSLALNSVDNSKLKKDDSSSVSDSKPPPSSRSQDQVVVLRVSLHCKGCEGKIRKHLSRMQGVTSFSIDSVAKKVTVVGDVTPLGVLASISKVKTAKLWTPAPSSASETKKSKALAAA